jgi:general secretion pathway protein D
MHSVRAGKIFLLAGISLPRLPLVCLFLVCLFLVNLSLANLCLAADTPSSSVPSPCSESTSAPGCAAPSAPAPSVAAVPVAPPTPTILSPKDLKSARRAFARGVKLEKTQEFDQAFHEFEDAARLAPSNPEYVLAREMTREHLAGLHLEQGNDDLLHGRKSQALDEFRSALKFDPQNEFAQLQMAQAMGGQTSPRVGRPQVVASADSINAEPPAALAGLHDIHYRGDSRGLISAVATSYGLTVVFDDSMVSRHVRFDLEQADLTTAMHAAEQATKSMIVPVEATVLLAAADNAENHRQFDRMGMRSFYIPNANQASDLNEFQNTLRSVFDFHFVSINAAASTITVRGPVGSLEAATKLLSQLNDPPAEVLLDVQVLEVNHTYARNIGLHVPNQFNLYNIPAAALASIGGANLQSLINQLVSSGGINQAGNSTIAALISQLEGQSSSLFSQPLATFGGGLTFFGLSLDQLAAVLSLNESSVRTLNHVTLRASQAKEATFKLGSRYPVVNGSFAPIYNSSAIGGVLQNQSYIPPVPSVSYEDLGLTLKAKPSIHRNSDVGLEVTVQFRALGGSNNNGIPIINQREYTGGVLLKDGDLAAVAGLVTVSDQRSLSGLPTFAQIPGFGFLVSQNSRMEMDDELMILIAPHVVGGPENGEAPEIWVNR